VSSPLLFAENVEVVAVVEDLTWALMRPVKDDGTRLLHFFQTRAFPTPKGMRVPISVAQLGRADLLQRRTLLAAIACLLSPNGFRTLGPTFGIIRSRDQSPYDSFLSFLSQADSEYFLGL
jgi:hypothetical protein